MSAGGTTAQRAELTRWRRSVMAAFAIGGVTTATWGPRLPAIKSQLHIGTATIGLLLAGVTVGGIAGLLLSNLVLRRLGSRRSVAGAIVTIAVAMGVLGAALALGSIALLSVGFLFVGVAIGTLDVLINVEGAEIERRAGRTLMPRMHGAWSVGAAVGSGIGAGCAALGVTPADQLLAEAATIALSALLVAPGVPRADLPAGRSSTGRRRAALRQWLRGWSDWRLLLIGVVMLGVELGEGSANSWLTLAVREDHGQSAAVAALFFSAFAVGEALSRVFGGPVVDRLGRVGAIRVTTTLGVLGMILFIQAGNRWLVLVGTILWSVGVSMGFPLGMSAAAESGPDPAQRVSVVGSIGYFAGLAGPPAIGALAERAGLLHALWLVAALFVAAFAVAGSLRRRDAAG